MTNTKLVRNVCIAAGAATVAGVGALFATAETLFKYSLDTQFKRSIFHSDKIGSDREEKLSTGETGKAVTWFNESKQQVNTTSDDGLKLSGWLLNPRTNSSTSHLYAICCHGYTGEPVEMSLWAQHFADLGFTVLLPAQRAHELSEGRYVGMGWLERKDVLKWIDVIIDSDPEARILLMGGSMGAATVMMTAGEPTLPRNVVAAIEDAGYGSVRGQFIDCAQSMFHMPKPLAALVVDVAGVLSKVQAGYDFTEASSVKQLKHTTIPMLFIHGSEDTFVLPKYLEMNYDACASLDREKLLVPGAEHMQSSTVAPVTYWRKVTSFVKRTFQLS